MRLNTVMGDIGLCNTTGVPTSRTKTIGGVGKIKTLNLTVGRTLRIDPIVYPRLLFPAIPGYVSEAITETNRVGMGPTTVTSDLAEAEAMVESIKCFSKGQSLIEFKSSANCERSKDLDVDLSVTIMTRDSTGSFTRIIKHPTFSASLPGYCPRTYYNETSTQYMTDTGLYAALPLAVLTAPIGDQNGLFPFTDVFIHDSSIPSSELLGRESCSYDDTFIMPVCDPLFDFRCKIFKQTISTCDLFNAESLHLRLSFGEVLWWETEELKYHVGNCFAQMTIVT